MITNDVLNQAMTIIYKENNPSLSLLRVRLGLSLDDATSVMEHLVNVGFISDYKCNSPQILKAPNQFSGDIIEKTKVPTKNDINYDQLDGHAFEYFCADLLNFNGFNKVSVTTGSGDFGVDILCEKNNKTYAFQCKCYSSAVGNKAVQEIYSGKAFYKCDIAVVLTNNYFTPSADETARLTGVELWNRGRLNDLLINALNNGYQVKDY